MRLANFLGFTPLAACSLLHSSPQHIFSNPDCTSKHTTFNIPTSFESAILARRILNLTPQGTLSTVFPNPPSNDVSSLENRPSGLAGQPIGLMDYIADCEEQGNPTILAINIATSFKNAAAGSNVSLALAWTPPHLPKSRIGATATKYSGANLPRFSLIGYLEKMSEEEVEAKSIGKCFTKTHQDAKYWLPGNHIHQSEWVRLVVQDVYWVGGFGDRAYIGWIPVEEWRNVTTKEREDVRLPGEKKGWKEWAVESFGTWEL